MKRIGQAVLLAVLMVAAACGKRGAPSDGGDNGNGPSGPFDAGGNGPGTGASGVSLIVVKDSSGALVSQSGVHVDSRGHLWALDWETAKVAAYQAAPQPLYYVGSGCTGTAYAAAPMPRVPFRVSGESAYRVRPDTMQSQAGVAISSSKDAAGSCASTTVGPARLLPINATSQPSPAVVEPMLGFAPPFRQELE